MTTITEQYSVLSSSSQYCLSEYFLDQIRQYGNNPCFFIKAADLRNRLFELVLSQPVIVTEPSGFNAVQVKLQANHIVMPQGDGDNFKLVNVAKQKGGRQGEHAKGHYTPVMHFGEALIKQNLLTQSDIDNLINYAAIWEANGSNNYTPGSAAAKQRCWLTPRTNEGYVTFVLTERADKDGNYVPALEQFAWTADNFSIIGSGVTETAVNVNAAPAIAMTPGAAPITTAPVGGRVLA